MLGSTDGARDGQRCDNVRSEEARPESGSQSAAREMSAGYGDDEAGLSLSLPLSLPLSFLSLFLRTFLDE